ncbi:MAG: HAD-IA family hydrolase [Chloroflexi bacterium]|nr:HAD-IA family hydrolase [Chloroflexota bacterium]
MLPFREIDLDGIEVLLCDADGNLFPSEEPAFVASADVTNRFMQECGLDRRFTPTELRLATTGKNFRTTAVDLARQQGVTLDPTLTAQYSRATTAAEAARGDGRTLTANALDCWVAEEKREVTAYLRETLRPDPGVIEPLTALSRRFVLAVVSSSATSRLAACFEVTGLAPLFPEDRRFSAEDSLLTPTSKPDPAIYTYAGARLDITTDQGLAIEDSVPGARSAVAAGYQTIGNVLFVPPVERPARIEALREVGAVGVIACWRELADLLGAGNRT